MHVLYCLIKLSFELFMHFVQFFLVFFQPCICLINLHVPLTLKETVMIIIICLGFFVFLETGVYPEKLHVLYCLIKISILLYLSCILFYFFQPCMCLINLHVPLGETETVKLYDISFLQNIQCTSKPNKHICSVQLSEGNICADLLHTQLKPQLDLT